MDAERIHGLSGLRQKSRSASVAPPSDMPRLRRRYACAKRAGLSPLLPSNTAAEEGPRPLPSRGHPCTCRGAPAGDRRPRCRTGSARRPTRRCSSSPSGPQRTRDTPVPCAGDASHPLRHRPAGPPAPRPVSAGGPVRAREEATPRDHALAGLRAPARPAAGRGLGRPQAASGRHPHAPRHCPLSPRPASATPEASPRPRWTGHHIPPRCPGRS